MPKWVIRTAVAGCAENAPVGTRTEALDSEAWEQSVWISASVTLPGEKESRTYGPGKYEVSF